MRVLFVHTETQFFAGAQKVLGYFLEEILCSGREVAIAMAENSKLAGLIPSEIAICPLTNNQSFSLGGLRKQVGELMDFQREFSANIIHGWTARDWELTTLAGRIMHCPSSGTLHDHPHAQFISSKRQKLMRVAANFGLQRVVCVSNAVKQACQNAGYATSKLAVIHNGLPKRGHVSPQKSSKIIRLGYLGAFSERKGFRGLFEILEKLGQNSQLEWEMCLTGAAQSPEAESLLDEIRARYALSGWWNRVHWSGWTDRPMDFLSSLDVLICPSSEFDPFPTVLLEAGKVGVSVVAARVGGVAEIIEDGKTGWIFEARDWCGGARKLEGLIQNPEQLDRSGRAAKARIDESFSANKMVDSYYNLFKTLI